MKTIQINPQYAQNNMLNSFINNLPDSFVDGGDILWNGRNAMHDLKRYKHN